MRDLTRREHDVAEQLARAEARAHEFPHRERYLRLNHAFMRAILKAHTELVDRVEEELA